MRKVCPGCTLLAVSCFQTLTCEHSMTRKGALYRCHRLKRPCHPADAVRRRSDKKQNSSEARIAKLEGTLGQLVSMLQAGNVHGERVDEWSQQQQQQSPPQQHEQHQQQPPPPP